MSAENDLRSDRAARLLLAERDAILPILRRTESACFDRPTVCAGWSVRDVLAHCAAALTRVATGNLHRFRPEDNEADAEERRSWPVAQVLAELEAGYLGAAEAIAAAGGRLDGVALGEWVHGGDVREALGEPGAYTSEGIEDALVLLAERSRRRAPSTAVLLIDRDLRLTLGPEAPAGSAAQLTTDTETLIRLSSGRHPDLSRHQLEGAELTDYVLFA